MPAINQIKTFPYSDILGWSVSRFDRFSSCKRQYYYDYYAKFDREFPKSKIDSLKKLTSIPLEMGNIFHDSVKALLERLLVSEKPVDKAKFAGYVADMAKEYCSRKVFSEIYYKTKQEIKVEEIIENVNKLFANLFASERYGWIIKEAIENKTGWVIEPPGYGETRIEGLKAYCKVDFLFPVRSNIYILDWKTGKPDERKHKKQLVGYATWASFHFNAAPENIYPVAVYLQPVYNEMKLTVSKADIREFAELVRKETEEMNSYLKDSSYNIPKDKEEFRMTENPNLCRYCNYKELCKRQ